MTSSAAGPAADEPAPAAPAHAADQEQAPCPPAERRARVVLLAGPSGCGKTYLALRTGLPILALDDFYRADTDPDMPRTPDGVVDWEDPRSWNALAACNAAEQLCRHGRAEVPNYVFGENRAVGHRTVELGDAQILIAEGLFAAELIAPLRDRGVLADGLLIHDGRWRTFARRLLRDVREARKSRWYLVRQGWAKTMAEPAVVRRLEALGARPVTKAEALQAIEDLVERSAG